MDKEYSNEENPQNTSDLWKDTINPQSGEHSIKEITPKVVKTYCSDDDHFFELTPQHTVECKKCGLGRHFVLGRMKIIDGKIVSSD